MKNMIGAGLLGAAALCCVPAMAQEEIRPYIGVGYGLVFHDENRFSDDGDGLWVSGGFAVSNNWGLEVSAFHHEFDAAVGGGTVWKETGAKFDSLYFLSRNAAFSPYLGLGIGLMEQSLNNTGLDSTDLLADAGVGFTTFPIDALDLGLRFDARYRVTDSDIVGVRQFDETVVRLGLIMPLGTAESSAAPAAAAATSTSSSAAAPGKAKDGGKDSDGDGVADANDSCPGTARGLTVDAKGCPISAAQAGPNRSFENVNFAYDKDVLTDYAKATLDSAAGAIGGLVQKYPKLKVDVSGHTDWVGTDAYNQALSERRANSVKEYLVKKGVDGSRINTYSYGESKPLATNDTDEGRAINRRAEIRTHE